MSAKTEVPEEIMITDFLHESSEKVEATLILRHDFRSSHDCHVALDILFNYSDGQNNVEITVRCYTANSMNYGHNDLHDQILKDLSNELKMSGIICGEVERPKFSSAVCFKTTITWDNLKDRIKSIATEAISQYLNLSVQT